MGKNVVCRRREVMLISTPACIFDALSVRLTVTITVRMLSNRSFSLAVETGRNPRTSESNLSTRWHDDSDRIGQDRGNTSCSSGGLRVDHGLD